MKVIIIVCTKKKFRTNGPFGSALRIFLNFCRMKGANRYMKILLLVFREKIHLAQFDLFSL